jgi:excisionase family DNA binding protein
MDEKIDQHDVAKYLGVSTRTVRNLVKRSELPAPIRIGRNQFWLKGKFMRWLEDGGAASIQEQPAARSSKLGAPRGRPRLSV